MGSKKYTKFITFIFLLSNLFGEYSLPANCYLEFTDTLGMKTAVHYDSVFPNVTVPNYLYDYDIPQKKIYANFFFKFENNDDLFHTQDSLFLVIPAIGSVDICYLNKKKIGQTGNLPPYYEPAFYTIRKYYIPKKLLKKENLLQIQVYSPDKNGGIVESVPQIYSVNELKKTGNYINNSDNFSAMPLSNGIAVANFDKINLHFNNFYPSIYRNYSKNQHTEILLQKLTPRIYQNGSEINLQTATSSTHYIEGTGIIEHKIQLQNNTVTLFGFCPFNKQEALWIFYLVVEGENISGFSPDFYIEKKSAKLEVIKEAFSSKNKKWLRLILYSPGINANGFSLTKYKNMYKNFELLLQELNWWKNWQLQGDIPQNLSSLQLSEYLQSLAMLKMSQSREDFPVRGQIVSSLPPGNNRVNLLDQTLAIEALLTAKHHQEALSCMQFLFHGRCSKYKNYSLFDNNSGLLNNYLLSTNDYYSNGTEKEINPDEAIISLAGFGLTLSNIRYYVDETKDYQFIEYYWEKIYKEIALVLINLIDETDLIRKESGFFEQELPGKHFTYTSALIFDGLIDAAWLARLMTQETVAQEMELYANKIRRNIQYRLFDENSKNIRASLEGRTKDHYLDATVLALNNYIFSSQDEISYHVLRTVENNLTNPSNPLIYSKYSFNFLDREISPLLNFNLAEAYYKINDNDKGDKLINFIIESAQQNSGILVDRIDPVFNRMSGCYSTRSHSGYIKAIHYKK